MDINKIKEKIGLLSDSPVWREAEPTVLQIPINQVTAYRCPSCRRVYLSKLEQGEQPHIEDNEIILPHLII